MALRKKKKEEEKKEKNGLERAVSLCENSSRNAQNSLIDRFNTFSASRSRFTLQYFFFEFKVKKGQNIYTYLGIVKKI